MPSTIDAQTGEVSDSLPPAGTSNLPDDGVSDTVTITAPASAFQWLPWLVIGGLVLWYLKDGQNKGRDLW